MAKTTQSSPASAPETLSTDPHATDPALLRDHSQFKSYKTSRFEYPEIRVFFRQHVKADQLPKKPAPLPLLVCIPGLGGSVAQFHPLLRSLVDLAPCLAIDWPGGGRSKFAPTRWEAYTSEALMELLEVIIEDHRDKEHDQGVVLIAHSMGTILSAGLANTKFPHKTSIAKHVVGLVAICPVSGPMDESKAKMIKPLFWIPGWIFALWRKWDARGGPNSASVARFVGEGAPAELKLMQYQYNQQSRTPVWRRMAYGALATRYEDGKPIGGIPGSEAWAGLDIPVFLIGGEKDNVTPPKEVDKVVKAFHSLDDTMAHDEAPLSVSELGSPASVNGSIQLDADANANNLTVEDAEDSDANGPSTPVEYQPDLPPQSQHPMRAVRSIILTGAAANHTLLYSPRTVRALAGLVSDFLSEHITQRLSLAWQLQHLSREGKWDVKNLLKWQGVKPVSEPIGPSGKPVFRVIKTLREADDVHCPAVVAEKWGHVIKDVIDISKDQPVYDPRGLERRGIHYHKFPTVSKIPPEGETVDQFIKLVDAIREAQRERAAAEGWSDPEQCVVGVHCHYGYNRSGYFVVCYLVEKCGFALADAIEAFKTARPNGIRHSHFLDKLYMRYDLEERPVEN